MKIYLVIQLRSGERHEIPMTLVDLMILTYMNKAAELGLRFMR